MLVAVGAVRLIDRALGAASGARRVIAVGPSRPGTPGVLWQRESPAGGGPVAALAAGLNLVEEPLTVLLAADLPFVTDEHVRRLVVALSPSDDGAMFVDP